MYRATVLCMLADCTSAPKWNGAIVNVICSTCVLYCSTSVKNVSDPHRWSLLSFFFLCLTYFCLQLQPREQHVGRGARRQRPSLQIRSLAGCVPGKTAVAATFHWHQGEKLSEAVKYSTVHVTHAYQVISNRNATQSSLPLHTQRHTCTSLNAGHTQDN